MEELCKNDIIETEITALGINGEGVAKVDGKAVFIRGALVGEKVRAKIILVKPAFCVAIIEKILSQSPKRIAPLCPVFNKCGGCDIQHLDYSATLELKRDTVYQTLKRVGGIEVEVNPTVASEKIYRYRNKVSFPVRQSKFGVEIGLFAKNSHRLIPVVDCPLQYELAGKIVSKVKDFIQRNDLVGYNEENFSGDIRHIVIRTVGTVTTVSIVATKKIKLDGLLSDLNALCPDISLYLNINKKRNNVILGDEWQFVGGKTQTVVSGLKVTVHPASFWQVNDDIREKIYNHACSLISGSYAIEAYSGAGLLSARLAKSAKQVYGIEINPQAHQSAVTLCQDNGITNFTPICDDAGKALKPTVEKCKGETFIVVDPPRAGLDENACSALINSGANNIVYISCNPATLARDCKILCDHYSIVSVTPYDMFPQTSNVETVVVLRKQNA
ncbi:MAG: 23S rRNA (uracil(1939)-C(5))-methyltransferase RlmD [Clostridia bacterium]|nr:23S rRNA (uracil(1939)-C(5))-methyltransferase RlmD [Clostridia bacterium]